MDEKTFNERAKTDKEGYHWSDFLLIYIVYYPLYFLVIILLVIVNGIFFTKKYLSKCRVFLFHWCELDKIPSNLFKIKASRQVNLRMLADDFLVLGKRILCLPGIIVIEFLMVFFLSVFLTFEIFFVFFRRLVWRVIIVLQNKGVDVVFK